MLAAAPLLGQPVQVYFVPIDESHVLTLAEAINAAAPTPPASDTAHTVISLSSTSDGTVVTYDHWEDGFEADLENPVQASTQIINLDAGDFSVLENDVPANPRDSGVILFDARDRIGASNQIAVTRGGWRLQEGTLLAGAVEVFPTIDWGTRFEAPVGEDLPDVAYEFVAASITAAELGAILEIYLDGDGTVDEVRRLGPGENTLIQGVVTGSVFTSSDPIEAHLLTGDRASSFAGRWYSMVPTEEWSDSYFNPVGSASDGTPTTVTLYNPGTSAITVTHETLQVMTATTSVENTTPGTIDGTTTCAAPLVRTFAFASTTAVESVQLGFVADHVFRGDIQVTLESPSGTRVVAIASNGGDGNDNYDLLLDGASAAAINDGTVDNTAAPFYDRTAAPSNSLGGFSGEDPAGTWTLEVCDTFTGSDNGTFQRARLDITQATGAPTVVSGTVSVPAGDVATFTMPPDSGGHFFTATEEPFFAVTAVDFLTTAHDWGFTLLPEDNLTTTLVVGWAPGRDPTSATNPTENGSPIWVTANAMTDLFVDFDGDPTTGTLIDAQGNRYDQLVPIENLESIQLFDTGDGDQSGARIYTLDGTLITAAWGQDPITASPAAPALDLGTTVLPITRVRVVKEGLLIDDVDGDGGIDPGETIQYTITVTNVSDAIVPTSELEDTGLDVNVDYVPMTTEVDGVALADDGTGTTVFPLDEGGISLGALAIDQVVVVTFNVTVDSPFPGGVEGLSNVVEVRAGPDVETDTTDVPVGDPELALTKVSDAGGDVQPGDVITYTLSISNTAGVVHRGLKVLDTLPTGVAYVAESTSVSGFIAGELSSTYDNTTTGVISSATPCTTPLVRTFAVTDTFALVSLDLGFSSDHVFRGDIQATLESPAGTRVIVIATSGADGNDNYDVLLTTGAGALNDGSADDTTAPFFDRSVEPSNALSAFAGEVVTGTWQLEICDTFVGADDGTFLRSQLVVRGQSTVAEVKTNTAAAVSPLLDGIPTNLVLAPDEFELQPAQAMTITYQVQVADPLDINTTSVVNTAFASSIQQPFPVVATVVDPVSRGGVIGDRVWLDVDGDGVQELGEPGLANVTVELFDAGPDGMPGGGDDVSAGTVTTDANGNYLFDRLSPGTYYVDVDGATLPSGLATSPGTTDPSSVVTITAEEVFLDVDFGYSNADPASAIIGDFVWSDADADGVQDAGEIGLAGVDVELIDGTGAVVATTTTGSDGSYLFAGVTPGEYTVRIAAAELGTGGTLEGFNATTGPQSEGGAISAPLTVGAGEVVLDVDFGFDAPTATFAVDDVFWLDLDADGNLDSDEPRLEGVTIDLLDAGGNVVATTTSASDGTVSFAGLPPGSYTLSVSDNAGVLVGLGGTTTPAQSRAQSVTITTSDVSGVNFGFNAVGTLGDRIWNDADGDGVQDAGETGLPGVTIELLDRGGMVIATTTTDAAGNYLFEGLAPEQYSVRVDVATLPAGYALTGDPDGTADSQSTVVLDFNQSDLSLDFGYQNASLPDLSGTVFEDLDADGLEEAGDPGFTGVTVELRNTAGVVLATTSTDAMGNYTFPDLADGDYSVVVTDQNGVLENYQLTSGLDALPATIAGADVMDVDFGYARNPDTASIGDVLWLDADRDGVEGSSEPGLAGVTLELFDAGPDGVIGGGDDVLLGTTVTDANGGYVFDGLAPGSYFVDVDESTLPTGFSETTYPMGVDPSAVVLLSEGENFDDADFGYQATTGSAVGDTVWFDLDSDGVQDPGELGIPGVDVTVSGPSGNFTVTTGADGTWLVPGLAPGEYFATVDTSTLPAGVSTTPTNADVTYQLMVEADVDYYFLDWGFAGGTFGSIGDTIWLDEDGDGVEDGGEPGIAGVTVNLLDVGGAIIATTTTDDQGGYDFTGVPAGTYSVAVSDIDGVLAGLNLSSAPVGMITLAAGQDFDTADFGYAPSGGIGSIGSQVWRDLDGGGTFDAGESGLQGVTVDLWLDVDNDGVITPGVDNLLRTETTGANGEYAFTGLVPGDYIVDVTDTAGVTAGFTLTDGGMPGVDNTSQADPYAVTLTDIAPNNETADFGYFLAAGNDISGTIFEDADEDGLYDQPDELPVMGVTVDLFRVVDGMTVFIGTTTADVNGDYSFTDLPDGDYVVQVDTGGSSVDGYRQTTQTGSGGVQPVTLAGADSVDNDFGFFDGGTITNPVTLAYFETDGQVFEWGTETEVGNLGFHLYRFDSEAQRWQRINPEMVPSPVVDSVLPQSYRFVSGMTSADAYLLEDVDIRGRSRFHGPFKAFEVHGAKVRSAPIDWPAVHRARQQAYARRPEVGSVAAVDLRVDRPGLYRVRYEDLAAAGLDLAGVPSESLAMTRGGTAVPRFVDGGAIFGPGSVIEWVADARDDLYTQTEVYRLSEEPSAAIEVFTAVASQAIHRPEPFYVETDRFARQRSYSFGSPNGDPWFDTSLRAAGGPVAVSFPLVLEDWQPGGHPVTVQADVWGVTNWPQQGDHHVEIRVNGITMADEVFDGLTARSYTFEVSDALLAGDGTDVLEVVLPHDTGVPVDLVYFEGFSVRYPRLTRARDGLLDATLAGRSLAVDGLTGENVVIWVEAPDGTRRLTDPEMTETAFGYRVNVPGLAFGQTARYVVTSLDQARTAEVVPARLGGEILKGDAELLIISHGDFLDGLAPLVAARRAEGLTVRVVDVADVFGRYRHGVFDPVAIRELVVDAVAHLGTRYVLLVGSDTYDYRNFGASGSISFVPTLYAQTDDIVRFAPADSLFGDVDGDGVPEVAVGRFPVRTAAELDSVVAKTLAYATATPARTAIVAADEFDRGAAYSFRRDSEAVAALLGEGWTIERAYMDDLGLADARTKLLDAFDRGAALVSFFGHSGPTVWSFSGLFRASDSTNLGNVGRPAVVTQWGCWNTYYVSPSSETLGHRLMTSGDQGAAAVLGASTLTTAESERRLGLRLFAELRVPGRRLGDAVIEAKRDLAFDAGTEGLLDVLIGWTLLGDPTLEVLP